MYRRSCQLWQLQCEESLIRIDDLICPACLGYVLWVSLRWKHSCATQYPYCVNKHIVDEMRLMLKVMDFIGVVSKDEQMVGPMNIGRCCTVRRRERFLHLFVQLRSWVNVCNYRSFAFSFNFLDCFVQLCSWVVCPQRSRCRSTA